nr:DNA internalization-related competence protein ComEC/Rec2 [Leucothrix arctica]
MLVIQLTVLPSLLFCAIILIVMVLFAIFLQSYQRTRLVLCSLVIIGFFLTATAANLRLKSSFPALVEGKDLIVSGQVSSLIQQKAFSRSFLFDVEKASIEATGEPLNWSGQIRVSVYRDAMSIAAGEQWQFQVRMKRPNGFMNPAGFDYERFLFAENIKATGYLRKSKKHKRLAEAPWYSVSAVRESIDSKITSLLKGDAQSIERALILAEKGNISPKQWEILRATGTSHLMAISGLHIGLVAGAGLMIVWGLYWLFPGLSLIVPRQISGCAVGVVLATFYAMLAGFSIPTQRALLMVIVALIALMSKRHYRPVSILAVALVVVLLINPLAIMNVGFYLSFSAVGLILWLLSRHVAEGRFQLLRLQLFLSLVMIPLGLLFFGEGSVVSPLANLIAIPWVSFVIVPFSFLAVLLSYINEAFSTLVFNFVSFHIRGLFIILELLSGLPKASISMHHLPFYLSLLAVISSCLFILPKGLPWRYLSILLVVPLTTFQVQRPQATGDFRITVLDVGQGLSTIIETQTHTLVYDAGDKPSENFDLGKVVVLPYLQKQSIQIIDRLVISHGDRDHSGGAQALLTELEVNQLISSNNELGLSQEAEGCLAEQEWVWDGVKFEFLHPSPTTVGNDNNQSCVLKVSNSKHAVLLTGDIERSAEKQLIREQADKLPADILLMPHHGSHSSSTKAFIEQVNPIWAISSASYRSRFHHPSQKVVKRYEDQGIAVLKTADSGAISFDVSESLGIDEILFYRQERQGFWSRPALKNE